MVGGIDFAVRYPFTSAAKEILKSDSFAAVTDEIADMAVRRITDALNGTARKGVYAGNEEKREDLLAYAAARMILGYMRNNYLTNKFAVSESKKVRSFLDDESMENVDALATELGIPSVRKENALLVRLPVFLRFTPRSPHYQLINRRITSGFVAITEPEKKRMMEEAVRKHIERLPLVKNPPERIVSSAKRLLDELPKREIRAVAELEGSHPPCIVELIDAVKKHQNLPHPARFYLAVYLMGIGLSNEKIISFFSNFPDFSEKITKYQVEHARKRGYSVPSCASVVGYGLCRANCGIGSPLNWHKRAGK
ncbi:hypothetical protein H0O02_05170 [Candidatus Micrarchaeota archaeon]|nr:hypothetical protein [Candidatus Micrarchaeota archaeon]